jgi:hypothetical protein
MRFDPVIALPNAWTSACGPFVLHLFEGQLSIADMNYMQDLAARWLVKNPQPRVELSVVLPSSARMTLDERQRVASLIKQGERQRTASATVILAEGLTGSFQRSVLTGLMLLVPPPHPTKVFASIQDSVRWLFPYANLLMELELQPLFAAVDAHVARFRTRTRDAGASLSR